MCLFEGVVTTTGGLTDLWTVPTGYVDVLRDLDGYTTYGGAANATLHVGGLYFCINPSPSAGAPVAWRGRQVFVAGQTVKVFLDHGPWNLRLCGYRLVA